MTPLGDTLLAAAANCRRRALLVAPFIKVSTLKRVLSAFDPNVRVDVFTRWRPEEVAAGVSDLEVFDILVESGRALWLCHALHAKYYRLDDDVWVGSANLTATALGWTAAPNLELLLSVPFGIEVFSSFEAALRSSAIRATVEIRDAVLRASEMFVSPAVESSGEAAIAARSESVWVPLSRNPERLFRAYSKGLADLTSSGQEQSHGDLAALALPGSLVEPGFNAAVQCALLQNRIVRAIDDYAGTARRFGEMRELLKRELLELESERDPTEAWQTMMRWLRHFLPERYVVEVPNFSERFQRRG